MFVRDRMTGMSFFAGPDTTVPDALRRMREGHVRCLPVIDALGRLAGIVSESDLRHAVQPPAMARDGWENDERVATVKVAQLMQHNVATVTEDTPLEEAARANGPGCLRTGSPGRSQRRTRAAPPATSPQT